MIDSIKSSLAIINFMPSTLPSAKRFVPVGWKKGEVSKKNRESSGRGKCPEENRGTNVRGWSGIPKDPGKAFRCSFMPPESFAIQQWKIRRWSFSRIAMIWTINFLASSNAVMKFSIRCPYKPKVGIAYVNSFKLPAVGWSLLPFKSFFLKRSTNLRRDYGWQDECPSFRLDEISSSSPMKRIGVSMI